MTIRLFGDFVLQKEGQPCLPTRTRKEQWVLALLVLRSPKPTERAWLSGVLWPDSSGTQAAENLRHSLSNLRKVLGPDAVRITAPTARTIAFETAHAAIDILDFDAALLQGDAASLEKATAVYRGHLLEGCEEDWILPERHKRAEAYANTLETLAKQLLGAGATERAISYLRKLILADPLRASAQRLLMQALAAIGDYTAVTQVYRNFRITLNEELQVQPDPETVALYEELRHRRKRVVQTPTLEQPTGTVSLPSTLTQLVGREAEVGAVSSCLTSSRLVTLTGSGGTGKTRLAIAVGSHMRRTFAEQVWYVSLAEMFDTKRLAEFVRDGFGLTRDQADPFGQVVRRLSTRPSLLILDNYEHLVEGGARFVEALLTSVPALVCLVTSRRPLHLAGETQYRVPSLGFPTAVKPVPLLLQYSCVRLFVERAAARRSSFRLTQENAPDVVALCAKLEGIPLAIELVAAWADMLTPLQMRMRLDAQFAFPADSNTPMPERHASLQAVFDSSYALLSLEEQQMLCCLAVFAGGWTLEAAEAVFASSTLRETLQHPAGTPTSSSGASAAGGTPPLLLLKRLVEKSLVMFRESESLETEQPRYELLELTRQYALQQMSREEHAHVLRRHADYFLQQALSVAAGIENYESARRSYYGQIQDSANYHTALEYWKQKGSEEAICMIAAMSDCGLVTRHSSEAKEWISRLASQEMPMASAHQARLYSLVASWAIHSATPGWQALMEKAYQMAAACDDHEKMAYALCHLGVEDLRLQNLESARSRLEAARNYCRQVGDRRQAGFAEQQLIMVTCAETDFARTRAMAEALLRSGHEENLWYLKAFALEALLNIADWQQDYSSARVYGDQAMALYPDDEVVFRCNMLMKLGAIAVLTGDFRAARDYIDSSTQISLATGNVPHEAWSYYTLAHVAHREGHAEEGREWLRRALQLFEMLGEKGSILKCIGRMARLSADFPEEAALLWYAYDRILQESGYQYSAEERKHNASVRETNESHLSEPARSVQEKRSACMSMAEVIGFAMKCGLGAVQQPAS